MDCTIPRSEFLGEETFIGPDNCEYNKVKITSNWNQLSISLYDMATSTELRNEIFTIPEGEYDYYTLQAYIRGHFELFHYEKTEHLFRVTCNDWTINYPWLEEKEQGETWSANFIRTYGSELNDIIDMSYFEGIDDLDYYQDYFFIEYIDVNNYFEYPNYERVVTIIKQCENGIDKILPFTCPIRTFNDLNNDIEIINYYSYKFERGTDGYPHRFIYNCGLSPVFFKLYWLNENFFTSTNPQYYNEDLILDPGKRRITDHSIYFNLGKYTKYGYCMSILYELLCIFGRDYNFIPINNKDNTSIVYLIGCDSDYQLTDCNNFINLTKNTDHNLLYIDSTDENKNTSCDSCINCIKCINCHHCTSCTNCKDCNDSTNCNNCNNCSNCYNVY